MKRPESILLLLLVTIFSHTILAESEPNNTYQQAITLGINLSDGGALNAATQSVQADNDDFWKVTLPLDGSIYFETTSSGDLEIDLYIIDSNGSTSLVSGTRYGVKEWISHVSLKAGTYYLRVYRYSGTGTYSLLNRFTAAPYSNDSEPNDTYQTAQLLNLNSESTGHIKYYQNGSTDYDDYWKVVIPSDGSLKVVTESDSAEIDIYMIDINGNNTIVTGASYGLKEQVVHNCLMPGTYFIRVYGYNAHGGYKITTTFVQTSLGGVQTNDVEKNDTYSTSQSLATFNGTASATNYGHLGFYTNGYTDYDDYWSVTTGTDGKLVVKTESNSTLDIDLYLVDVNGSSTIGSAYSTGAMEELTFSNLAAGKYYVRAYRSTGYGSYKITAQLSVPTMSNDQETNNLPANALTIVPEAKMYGHLGYYSNSFTDNDDYYVLTLSSKWDSLYVRSDSDPSLDVDLYLLNTPTNNIATAYSTGTREILKYSNAVAGTYYVRAYRSTGQGSYALKVTNKYPGTILSEVKSELELPTEYKLTQNYPNPFNPETTISFAIPNSGWVSLIVYDVTGKEVSRVLDEEKSVGKYEVKFNGRNLSSGIYFYQLKAGSFIDTKKLVLLK